MTKRLLILVAGILCMSLAAGCGGGGGSVIPAVYDLKGLEGIWDYTLNMKGTMTVDGGVIPVDAVDNGFFIITSSTVTDAAGNPWSWTYDRVTLTLKAGRVTTGWLDGCGDMYMTVSITFILPLEVGSTVAAVNGTGTGSILSTWCEPGVMNVTYTGSITKR